MSENLCSCDSSCISGYHDEMLRKEITRLRAERDAAQLISDDATQKLLAVCAENDKLTTTCATLREALRKYGQHETNCGIGLCQHIEPAEGICSCSCTCGLDAAPVEGREG